MDTSVGVITAWTLIEEIPIPGDVSDLLVEGEQAVAAFKTFRDSAIFTTKRLIVRDAQGMTGKKVEIYSLPYSSINMWSSENAGACWIATPNLSFGPALGTSRSSFTRSPTFADSTSSSPGRC